MSVKTEELIQVIDSISPRDLEEEWDNSGWQINLGKPEIQRVLVCLEITDEVISESILKKADFILTHHPLLFSPIKVIDYNNVVGNYIVNLVLSEKTVYSTHTSFDSAFGGINDDLAERVGLNKVRKLYKNILDEEKVEIMGRLGEYEQPKTMKEVCDIVKEALEIDKKLEVIGDPKSKIKKVAVCGGAGADAIPSLINTDCDLFITGDVKHHQAQMAKESGLCLINAGHYATEKFYAENMADKLKGRLGNKVDIIDSQINVEPYKLL